MSMFYAGIDWADDHHDIVVIDEAGTRKGSLRVVHSKAGLNELNSFLAQFTTTTDQNHIACIVETNHGLLIGALLDGGWPVYGLHPQTRTKMKASFSKILPLYF